ncbi:MAG: hypothetical protein E7249_01965 [Paenibacillaceae bacterium]|nr:hypothetical protein [Paenibacillaceae bacterium]
MKELYKEREKYKVAVIQENLISWIEEAVTTMTWGGSKDEASRTLNLEVTKVNGKTDFPNGSAIVIYDLADQELMRYIITKKSKTRSSTAIKYTARDVRWWLTRSKMDKKFENMTASEIISSLCKSLGISTGTIADTGVKFSVLHFIKKSPWDMIVIALTETRKQSGKRYTTRVKNGNLELIEKCKQTVQWVIEEGANLLDASYDESIESTYTQVKVVGKNSKGNEISAIQKNEGAQKLYGVMQEYISQSDKMTQAEVNAIAVQKLKELSVMQKSGTIKTFGLDDVETGTGIYVIDNETGLVGGFYVESDSHTYSNGYHEMSLTLAWTDELPEIEYEAPKEST